MTRVGFTTVTAAITLVFAGCTPAAPSAPEPPIAAMWKSRCSACHERPEPHSRDRAEVTAEFVKHRERVTLDEAQWAQMTDFISKP